MFCFNFFVHIVYSFSLYLRSRLYVSLAAVYRTYKPRFILRVDYELAECRNFKLGPLRAGSIIVEGLGTMGRDEDGM